MLRLLDLINEHVLGTDPRKLIVWANEPLTLQAVELLILALDVKHVSIRSGITASARMKAEDDFNNDPDVKIVVCSSRSCQESMNLQHGGYTHVALDVVSFTALLHMVGRTGRIGQTYVQYMHVLVLDGSYDQVLVANNIRRYAPEVASCTTIAHNLAEALKPTLSKVELADLTFSVSHKEGGDIIKALAELLERPCAEAVIQEKFGIRSSRSHKSWRNARDPHEKDVEPEDVLYRFAQGGQLADEIYDKLVRLPKNSAAKPVPNTPAHAKGVQPIIRQSVIPSGQHLVLAETVKKIGPGELDMAAQMCIDAANDLAEVPIYALMKLPCLSKC
jgi:hypothetical protein